MTMQCCRCFHRTRKYVCPKCSHRICSSCGITQRTPIRKLANKKFKFKYGAAKSQTVTVTATTEAKAMFKAIGLLNNRYDKRGLEPPVAWTLKRVRE